MGERSRTAVHCENQDDPACSHQAHNGHVQQEGVQLHDVVARIHIHEGEQLGGDEHEGSGDERGGGDGLGNRVRHDSVVGGVDEDAWSGGNRAIEEGVVGQVQSLVGSCTCFKLADRLPGQDGQHQGLHHDQDEGSEQGHLGLCLL